MMGQSLGVDIGAELPLPGEEERDLEMCDVWMAGTKACPSSDAGRSGKLGRGRGAVCQEGASGE